MIKSVRFAFEGLVHCFVSEKNFRIEVVAVCIAFLMAILFKLQSPEWLLILFCSALVLSLEIFNTALERLSDIVSNSFHPEIKIVKDLAAGAVLLSSAISIIIAGFIFIPRIEIIIKSFLR